MGAGQLTLHLLTPVATLAAVLTGLLCNHSGRRDPRSDIKDLLKAEIGRLEARVGRNHGETLSRFAELDGRVDGIEVRLAALKRRMDGIETRLAHIEGRLGVARP